MRRQTGAAVTAPVALMANADREEHPQSPKPQSKAATKVHGPTFFGFYLRGSRLAAIQLSMDSELENPSCPFAARFGVIRQIMV
jgi:hypothetical protein